MRIALGVEYNGFKFHGWQSQQQSKTVQATVDMALSKIADEPIGIFCAGRTDAGVHATNQVVHFDTNKCRKLDAWVLGTNSHLPSTIRVQWAKQVADSFHARFSALSRRYHYLIYNHSVRSALLSELTTWISQPLDVQSMHKAAQSLLGEHDFTSFRSADCQSRTSKRHIFAASVVHDTSLIKIELVANSFLHHMVRNIAGVLIDIGAKRKQIEWCRELLLKKNRGLAGITAPPQGLYLTGIRYADVYELPSDLRATLEIPSLLVGEG
jgi:tRNA pseudouridine38-40 synthase